MAAEAAEALVVAELELVVGALEEAGLAVALTPITTRPIVDTGRGTGTVNQEKGG